MKNSRIRIRTSTVAVTTRRVNTVHTTRPEDTVNMKAAEAVKEGLMTKTTEMVAVKAVHVPHPKLTIPLVLIHVHTRTSNQLTFRIYCKANPKFNLAIRDGRVVWLEPIPLMNARESPGFSLINLATGEALKHNNGEAQPVELAPYKPNECNTTLIWSESKVIEDEGYKAIRAVDNIHLNMDADLRDNPKSVMAIGLCCGDGRPEITRYGRSNHIDGLPLWWWQFADQRAWKDPHANATFLKNIFVSLNGDLSGLNY
ncbi:hypothetical protein F3Y22_tig00111155pilonHSYRG00008 [Hibiscus syriacus]|uniref:Uncharacterized protein n=1 Tax=Hibiscus syriacus TaxID=106335 RepID=A0A6A2YX95_HIBSY|nr:hypothetical protein F3Y22_tig00111155pilonHSYRG00008 [Hibiscus syriacus]